MKFWLVVFCVIISVATVSSYNNGHLADKIYAGILNQKGHSYTDGYAASSLKQRDLDIELSTEKTLPLFDEKTAALAYISDLLNIKTDVPQCLLGKKELTVRYKKALGEPVTLDKARAWVEHIRKHYCQGVFPDTATINLSPKYLIEHYPETVFVSRK
ncbi:hypothetical protein [Alteromonas sp. 14N.309.X.WAT.G.H12]|uniref:hypothetical protein n=1 Tax=Alteromonas sp. 14N.309.X.WAT.G.H12 TaxID=3120824 RepID=UPI002FD594AD